jgi:hypothetical protein
MAPLEPVVAISDWGTPFCRDTSELVLKKVGMTVWSGDCAKEEFVSGMLARWYVSSGSIRLGLASSCDRVPFGTARILSISSQAPGKHYRTRTAGTGCQMKSLAHYYSATTHMGTRTVTFDVRRLRS